MLSVSTTGDHGNTIETAYAYRQRGWIDLETSWTVTDREALRAEAQRDYPNYDLYERELSLGGYPGYEVVASYFSPTRAQSDCPPTECSLHSAAAGIYRYLLVEVDGSDPLLIRVTLDADAYHEAYDVEAVVRGTASEWVGRMGDEWDREVRAGIDALNAEADRILYGLQFSVEGSGAPPEPAPIDPGPAPDLPESPGSSDSVVPAVIGGLVVIGVAGAGAIGAVAWGVKKLARKPPAASSEQPAPGIYGSGTPDDPFRDDAAFKVNPDGSVARYPENAGRPPPIHGRGTPDDPYRDHTPAAGTSPDASPPPSPVATKPPEPKQPPVKKEPPRQKEPPKTYYLTASANRIGLAGGERRELQVEAWESVAGGAPVPCAASLQIIAPPQSGLTVTPSAGRGRLHASLSADRSARSGRYSLHVRGAAPDGQLVQAAIEVQVTANRYELRCHPRQFELRSGELRQVEIGLWRFLPHGGEELVRDLPVEVEALGADNPLAVEPARGSGQFQCEVSVPREARPKLYHLQARAHPPEAVEGIELLIGVRVLPPPSLAVLFDKPLWAPDSRVDLYSLGEGDHEALDRLAAEGGQLTVRAWGEYRGRGQTIRCPVPIEDGACRLERGGRVYEGVWEATEYGYLIRLPPDSGAQRSGSGPAGAGEVTVDVPIALNPQHTQVLDGLLHNVRRAGNALGAPVHEQGERYAHAYLEFISRAEARTLARRSEELSTWLFNAAAFARYSVESIAAFKLALKLHATAYRRFFDAMINFFVEMIFWLVEKAATKAWRTYVNRGKGAVKESLETQTKRSFEEILEGEARTLAEQTESLEGQLREATQEVSRSQATKERAEALLERSAQRARKGQQELVEVRAELEAQRSALEGLEEVEDEAARQAQEVARRRMEAQIEALERRAKRLEDSLTAGVKIRREVTGIIDDLEGKLNRKLREIRELTGELQGAKAQIVTLEEMQQGVRNSTTMDEIRRAVQGAKPGSATLDPQLRRALDAFADEQWKQLEEVVRYLEAHRGQLDNADELISRVRGLQVKLRKELGLETIKMTQNDFIVKSQLQRKLREINEANARVQRTAPRTAYRAMRRQDYADGALGWTFHKIDQGLEWLYPLHDWARDWIPLFAWSEDAVLWILEAMLGKLAQLSNLLIEFFHHQEAVRSVIAPGLRRTGMEKACALGLREAFFCFPKNALVALGHSLNPRRLTNAYAGRAGLQQSLKAGAESGYQNERQVQQRDAFTYFENALLLALTPGFEGAPHDPRRAASRSMLGHLRTITRTMDEYVQGFDAAQAGGGEALTALPARLWEAGEWTAQDVEALVEWLVWGVQSLAILLGALGLVTGVGAAAGGALLAGGALISLIGAPLRVAIVALWTMPNILGFQYDVMVAHALLYDVLYDGLPEPLDDLIVERYDAGLTARCGP
jgi:hypothetical protein